MSEEELLGGLLGFLLDEEAQEREHEGRELPTCALCGQPVRPGEPRRVRQDGQLEHLGCPAAER